MANTNFASLTSEQLTIWSRDFWRVARNMSFINQFAGSGPNAMVQKISELTKSEKGARAVITLLADMTGDGIIGDYTLEGNENVVTQEQLQEKQKRNTVKKKVTAAKSQPPKMKGEGAGERGEKTVDIDVLSDDEFMALPEDTLRRMRGDFG